MTKFFVMIAAMVAMVGVAKAEEVSITIDISDQMMYVETPYDRFEWPVSTGRKGYSTPRGAYQPYLMKKMHYSKKYDNAPMPDSIFFLDGYAIHATEAIDKLGRPASHGCVRLHPQDANWLYYIVGEYGMENTFIWIKN